MTKQEAEVPAPVVHVARIATTESLSGLSQLQYHVGYEASNPSNIHFRIWRNSGGGKFANSWISLSEVEKALANIPADGTFTAAALAPIAIGKSVNTSSFVGAALLSEGLIQRSEKVVRSYERNPNTAEWWSDLRALIDGCVSLDVPPMDKPAGHNGGVTAKVKPGKKSVAATHV